MSRLALLIAPLALVCACSSGGRWGHAKSYVPTSDEKAAVADAKELDAPMAQLKPEAWKGVKVRFFFVVEQRKAGADGAQYLTGTLRTLNEINGCENKYDEETCRVTIKPKAHEKVHVSMKLLPGDDGGHTGVSVGTLVRVVGVLEDKVDEEDGKLVVRASFYRHWPMGYYALEGELKQ